ncbi:Protein croquemort, partial [Orchesella cincta]
NLILSPGSQSFELWKNVSVPVYLEVYFFNWTNPTDLKNPDAHLRIPKLVEMGPYVFREHRGKVILNWHEENDTVTFLQNKTWHFEPSLSAGSLEDIVTTLNAPAVAAAFASQNYPHFMKSSLAIAMKLFDTSLHVQKSVRELTFEGYEDPLLELASILPGVMLPFDKFGWFYTRNNSATYDGIFNMYTGKGNIQNFGEMAKWNYRNTSYAYQSNCSSIKGSAGEFFPPDPQKDSVSIFSTDICRTITMPFKAGVRMNGLKGYRFWSDENMLDTSPENFNTRCFCSSGKCPPKGVIDVSTCKWNVPAFVSFPHFYLADPSYRLAVKGMKPNATNHEMYIDLEQTTGIPLQVEASMQINLLVESYPEYEILKNVPSLYFPIFWFKQRARIDDSFINQLKIINDISTAGYIIFGVMIWVGLAIQTTSYFSPKKYGLTREFQPLSTCDEQKA